MAEPHESTLPPPGRRHLALRSGDCHVALAVPGARGRGVHADRRVGSSWGKQIHEDINMKSEMRLLKLWISVAALAAFVLGEAVWAQQPITYPAKGQSGAQQDKDTGACQVWAKRNTGVDPVAVDQQPAAGPRGPAVGGGERVQ